MNVQYNLKFCHKWTPFEELRVFHRKHLRHLPYTETDTKTANSLLHFVHCWCDQRCCHKLLQESSTFTESYTKKDDTPRERYLKCAWNKWELDVRWIRDNFKWIFHRNIFFYPQTFLNSWSKLCQFHYFYKVLQFIEICSKFSTCTPCPMNIKAKDQV